MNFNALTQEVVDRGWDYIKTARIERFVNRSYQRLCARMAWPFLEETTTGTSPLAVTDLRHVLSVSAEEPLDYIDRRQLVANDADLSGTGSAQWWYLEGGSLKVYPADTATITVRYLKKPADLSGTDEPLIPSDFHDLIVDGAVVLCLKDDDEYGEARELEADLERGIAEMAHALMNRNYQDADSVQRTGAPGDYL
jgi:hypothetical protein